MKTAKRILATLLAALMSLGLLAFTAGASEPMSTGVHGELKISSPDHDVSTSGSREAVDLGGGPNGNMILWLQKQGRYIVELAPGVTEAMHMTLIIAPGLGTFQSGPIEVTLRNLRMRAPFISARMVEPAIKLTYLGQGKSFTLKLEGENVLTSPQEAKLGSGTHRTSNYLLNLENMDDNTINIEGPGSLTLDARGTANIGGLGKGYAQGGYPKVNINGGTVTAYGGDNMPGIGVDYTDGLDLYINGGTVTSTGGLGAPGIGDRIFWAEANPRFTGVTVNGGTVTAIGNGAPGIGGRMDESSGIVGTVHINGGVVTARDAAGEFPDIAGTSGAVDGDAVVFADRFLSTVALTRGLVFSNNVGTLFGDRVTVTGNVAFPAGSRLTVPSGKTLAVLEGKTVTNNGAIANDGTVLANMAGYGTLTPALHVHAYACTHTQPTCTETGIRTYACLCGDRYVERYGVALGCDWGEWTAIQAATIRTGGTEIRRCLRDVSHFEMRTTPPLPCPLPGFLQWILRYLFFGWLWMR